MRLSKTRWLNLCLWRIQHPNTEWTTLMNLQIRRPFDRFTQELVQALPRQMFHGSLRTTLSIEASCQSNTNRFRIFNRTYKMQSSRSAQWNPCIIMSLRILMAPNGPTFLWSIWTPNPTLMECKVTRTILGTQAPTETLWTLRKILHRFLCHARLRFQTVF